MTIKKGVRANTDSRRPPKYHDIGTEVANSSTGKSAAGSARKSASGATGSRPRPRVCAIGTKSANRTNRVAGPTGKVVAKVRRRSDDTRNHHVVYWFDALAQAGPAETPLSVQLAAARFVAEHCAGDKGIRAVWSLYESEPSQNKLSIAIWVVGRTRKAVESLPLQYGRYARRGVSATRDTDDHASFRLLYALKVGD